MTVQLAVSSGSTTEQVDKAVQHLIDFLSKSGSADLSDVRQELCRHYDSFTSTDAFTQAMSNETVVWDITSNRVALAGD